MIQYLSSPVKGNLLPVKKNKRLFQNQFFVWSVLGKLGCVFRAVPELVRLTCSDTVTVAEGHPIPCVYLRVLLCASWPHTALLNPITLACFLGSTEVRTLPTCMRAIHKKLVGKAQCPGQIPNPVIGCSFASPT